MWIGGIIDCDQSGFIKGRFTGSNISLIMDVIEYTDVKHIPGDIDFTSAKSKKKKMDSGTSSSPFQENRKPTRSVPEPTNDELKDFYTAINKSASKPAILCFIEPYAQEYVPKTSTADFPPALDDLYNKDLHGKNFPEVIDYYKSIK